MKRHALHAFSVFPYYTKSNARTNEEKRLQGLLYALKNGQRVTGPEGSQLATEWFARILAADPTKIPNNILGAKVCLIPVPSSTVTPTPASGSSWPMLELSERLASCGLAAAAHPVVVRTQQVERAHRVRGTDKPLPTVEDYANSLAVDLRAAAGFSSVTLVDDVLSSGSNAMGVALALARAGFAGPVRVLTATHTVSADFAGSLVQSQASDIVWLEGRSPRAFRANR